MNRIGYSISKLVSACLLVLAGCSGVTDSGGSAPPDAGKPQDVRLRFDPTVARTPKASKSLTMAPDWQPPVPTRTGPARLKPRVKPSKHWGVPRRTVGPHPSDAEIRAVSFLLEPLRPVPGASTAAETDALAAALRNEWHDDRAIEALERFLEAYPASRWAPGIHLNLGKISYDRGYFQAALAHWKAGWELGKGLVATKDREGRWTRHMYNPLMERVVTQDPALRTTQMATASRTGSRSRWGRIRSSRTWKT